jgi:hypothetical protein
MEAPVTWQPTPGLKVRGYFQDGEWGEKFVWELRCSHVGLSQTHQIMSGTIIRWLAATHLASDSKSSPLRQSVFSQWSHFLKSRQRCSALRSGISMITLAIATASASGSATSVLRGMLLCARSCHVECAHRFLLLTLYFFSFHVCCTSLLCISHLFAVGAVLVSQYVVECTIVVNLIVRSKSLSGFCTHMWRRMFQF